MHAARQHQYDRAIALTNAPVGSGWVGPVGCCFEPGRDILNQEKIAGNGYFPESGLKCLKAISKEKKIFMTT